MNSRGLIQLDGTFQLATAGREGVAVGTYGAVVIPPSPNPETLGRQDLMFKIDPRYQDYNRSGLQFIVTSDAEKNNFTIHVQRTRDVR
jgi:hypothetical protein